MAGVLGMYPWWDFPWVHSLVARNQGGHHSTTNSLNKMRDLLKYHKDIQLWEAKVAWRSSSSSGLTRCGEYVRQETCVGTSIWDCGKKGKVNTLAFLGEGRSQNEEHQIFQRIQCFIPIHVPQFIWSGSIDLDTTCRAGYFVGTCSAFVDYV